MLDQIKVVLCLAGIGAIAALGKLLQSMHPLSWRMVIGRMITGAVVSMIAGTVLVHIPDMPFLAIMGIGSALGVLGAEFVETWLKKFAERK